MKPDPIALALHRRRKALRLTQGQVAVRLGLSEGSATGISKWETGRAYPNVDSARRWAAALGCDLTITVREPR